MPNLEIWNEKANRIREMVANILAFDEHFKSNYGSVQGIAAIAKHMYAIIPMLPLSKI